MVEGNFGISILSKRIAATQYDVEAIPIDPPISRNTVLVVPKEVEARQRLAGGFVRHIVDYYRDNTPRPLRGAVASALRARAVPGILPPSRTVRRTEREGELSVRALPLDRASSPWYNGQNHKGDCPGTWRQTF